MEIINFSNPKKWDQIVYSFQEHDIYYAWGYVDGFRIHGDGEPVLLYYETEALRGMGVYMKRKIADADPFHSNLQDDIFDFITPYGYGGFILEGETSEENFHSFYKAYKKSLEQERVVSVFTRFHPVLRNSRLWEPTGEVTELGPTVTMYLDSCEEVWNNFKSENRTRIRKALKNGIEIRHGNKKELFLTFMDIYKETMDRDHADSYYYFEEGYYDSLFNNLHDNYELFYAVYEEQPIAMAIILFMNKQMHYHLAGSKAEFRTLAPSNLLMYEAACWGVEHGFDTFHIGGGLGASIDPLFQFKKGFNPKTDTSFSIGKSIIDEKKYKHLVDLRQQMDKTFDINSSFFPLYRK